MSYEQVVNLLWKSLEKVVVNPIGRLSRSAQMSLFTPALFRYATPPPLQEQDREDRQESLSVSTGPQEVRAALQQKNCAPPAAVDNNLLELPRIMVGKAPMQVLDGASAQERRTMHALTKKGFEIHTELRTDCGHFSTHCEEVIRVSKRLGATFMASGIGGAIDGRAIADATYRAARKSLECHLEKGVPNALEQAFLGSQSAIESYSQRRTSHEEAERDVAATMIIAVQESRYSPTIWLGYIGDVRAYLFRPHHGSRSPLPSPLAKRYHPPVETPCGSRMVCITRDHSAVCDLVERGLISRETARTHPLRGDLSRALGNTNNHKAQVLSVELAEKDRLILCSDGLWKELEDIEIAMVLERHSTTSDAANMLVSRALDHGGRDQVSLGLLSRERAVYRSYEWPDLNGDASEPEHWGPSNGLRPAPAAVPAAVDILQNANDDFFLA